MCGIAAFLAVFISLLAGTAGFSAAGTGEKGTLRVFSDVTVELEGKTVQAALPCSFSRLPARTPVTVSLTVEPGEGQSLYVKSVYAPLKVYADGVLLYQYGQQGTYPAFMEDPATAVELVRLPRSEEPIRVLLEYQSPAARNTLTIHPVLAGTQNAIYRHLAAALGFPFLFSALLLLSGVIILLISLFILSFERSGTAFLWLGLFTLATGCWTFGECNLTGLFIHNPTLLYLLAFTGLFTLTVPLLHFGMAMVDFRCDAPIRVLTAVIGYSAVAALALQLAGRMPLSRSMYLFHVLEPLALVVFAGHVLYESIRFHSSRARQFLLPMGVLAVFSVLEVVNYRVHFTYTLSLFFQIGVLLFVLITSVVGGGFIRDALKLRSDEQRLKYEMELMEYRMEEQKKHQQLLLENQETVRAQRHDLRHQLAVIRSFSQQDGDPRLTEYLDTLIAEIPSERGRLYCENAAVNAVVSHYAAQAEKQGVELSIQLTVPERTEQISDSNLCVILGNLFENAIEACGRMTEGRRFIRLRSRLQYGVLTIAMDNSFNGKALKKDGKFLSSKRDEIGTGLQSVTAMAEKHGGGAGFEADGLVFRSSVYVRL
jgi:signal transduction histidine kinase